MKISCARRSRIVAVIGIFLTLSATSGNTQEQAVIDAAAEAEEESVESTIEHIEALEAEGPREADTQEIIDEIPQPIKPPPGASRSNYTNTVPNIGGQKTVGADLIEADTQRYPLWDIDWTHKYLARLYTGKERLNSVSSIAFSIDYTFLAQQASYSTTDKNGASDVFRIYGNWLAVGDKSKTNGNLVFKYEHRAAIWGRQTPRDMGFTMGSALSTANYKENGWGWTDLYWKQTYKGGKSAFLVGHMDPGDWADQHTLLNAWTNLLNDAFYNNPAEAIPKRTFSFVGRLAFSDKWYGAVGVHDANGKDNHIDFRQVWDTPELFTWLEVGRRADNYSGFGETTHLHYWHQDERVAAGVGESWGLTASRSHVRENGFTTVVRVGYSEGDAAQMRRFVGVAVSKHIRVSDRIMAGIGWGSPPNKTLRNQTVVEALYRLQLTQNAVISPDLQVTFNPSLDETESVVYVFGLRFRLSF